MNDYHLSKNFKLSEFLNNSHGFQIVPSEENIINLSRLSGLLLQPIRDTYNTPIYITSGLRSIGLNAVVGGNDNSEHLYGYASDWYVKDQLLMLTLFYDIIKNYEFNQLIYYYNKDITKRFIHSSLVEKNNRHDIMVHSEDGFYHLDYFIKNVFNI